MRRNFSKFSFGKLDSNKIWILCEKYWKHSIEGKNGNGNILTRKVELESVTRGKVPQSKGRMVAEHSGETNPYITVL